MAKLETKAATETIKILRSTVCGGQRVEAGSTIEASINDANLLVGMKKAERVTAKASTVEADKKAEKPSKFSKKG